MSKFKIDIDTEQKSASIYNVKCMWPRLTHARRSDYNKLSIDLLLPADNMDTADFIDHVSKLKGGDKKEWKSGVDDKGVGYIKLVAAVNAVDKNGDPRNIRLYDGAGDRVDLEDYPAIGNYSTVNVRFGIGEWEYNRRVGVSFYLFSVQLIKLLEYKGPEEYQAIDNAWKPRKDKWDTPDDEYDGYNDTYETSEEYESNDYGEGEDAPEEASEDQTESTADRIRRMAQERSKVDDKDDIPF